jgi:hypothetical protein
MNARSPRATPWPPRLTDPAYAPQYVPPRTADRCIGLVTTQIARLEATRVVLAGLGTDAAGLECERRLGADHVVSRKPSTNSCPAPWKWDVVPGPSSAPRYQEASGPARQRGGVRWVQPQPPARVHQVDCGSEARGDAAAPHRDRRGLDGRGQGPQLEVRAATLNRSLRSPRGPKASAFCWWRVEW